MTKSFKILFFTLTSDPPLHSARNSIRPPWVAQFLTQHPNCNSIFLIPPCPQCCQFLGNTYFVIADAFQALAQAMGNPNSGEATKAAEYQGLDRFQ